MVGPWSPNVGCRMVAKTNEVRNNLNDFTSHSHLITQKCSSWQELLSINSGSSKTHPASICLFKVNNGNTRTMCEICSTLTIKTPQRRHWRRSGVFTVNLNRFHTLSWCFHSWLWTRKYRLCRDTTLVQTNIKYADDVITQTSYGFGKTRYLHINKAMFNNFGQEKTQFNWG